VLWEVISAQVSDDLCSGKSDDCALVKVMGYSESAMCSGKSDIWLW
jgi:hypothetical protein